MRGKCSPKQGNNKAVGAGMDIHKVDKLNEEAHLSGAYIRNLVKQLTCSTRSKDALSSEIDQQQEEHPIDIGAEGSSSIENCGVNNEESSSLTLTPQPPGPPPQPQHKKQVRRRLHTSKPYQERLLNMAEARREIVTALKFHRATMKQQEQQQQQQQQQQPPPPPEMKSKSKRNSRDSLPNHNNHLSCSASGSGFHSCPFSHPYPYYYNPWLLSSSITPPPLYQENNLHHLPLPNQPLGLNLNFQDFNIDNKNIVFSNYSNTSPSTSSSSPPEELIHLLPPTTTTQQVLIPMNNYDQSSINHNSSEDDEVGFHYAMDDKELAEIRSIGEQHQIEWNDTMNLVNSAWWSKFLNSMETGNYNNNPQPLPSWINNSNETLLDDYCSDDYMKDAALPCMEIEEIEGIEGDWLSS